MLAWELFWGGSNILLPGLAAVFLGLIMLFATWTLHRRAFPWFAGKARRVLVLPASHFQDLIDDVGKTPGIYRGCPMEHLNPSRRGILLQKLCKQVIADKYPHLKLEDPTPGQTINGRRRSQHHAEWDFTLGGRKIECKSSQLTWSAAKKRWGVCWRGIKVELPGVRKQMFDELFLAIYSPWQIHILKHDLCAGVLDDGVFTASTGSKITITGTRGEECWRASLDAILGKFNARNGRGTEVLQVSLADARAQLLLLEFAQSGNFEAAQAYSLAPLGKLSPSSRGYKIEQMGVEIDKLLNPRSEYSFVGFGDWTRDGRLQEMKSSSMIQYKKGTRWKWSCIFRSIKCALPGVRAVDEFHDLWLAIYCPLGIYFFLHGGSAAGLSTDGDRTESRGKNLQLYLRGETFQDLLDDAEAKLCSRGGSLLAKVLW